MKTKLLILGLMLIFISGCSQGITQAEMLRAVKFCVSKGNVKSLHLYYPFGKNRVECMDDTEVIIEALPPLK